MVGHQTIPDNVKLISGRMLQKALQIEPPVIIATEHILLVITPLCQMMRGSRND
jgi:hypothetical protein